MSIDTVAAERAALRRRGDGRAARPSASVRMRIGGADEAHACRAPGRRRRRTARWRAPARASIHSSSVLHFATAAGVASNACSHSSAVRAAKRLDQLVEHAVDPLAVGELRRATSGRRSRARRRRRGPTSRHSSRHRSVPLRLTCMPRPSLVVVRVQHRRVAGRGRDAEPAARAVEDRPAVQEQQRLEQRRLDVLAVAGRLALHERGTDAEHREQRGGDARHREGQPDRVVGGEQSLLRTGARVHERLPTRVVA